MVYLGGDVVVGEGATPPAPFELPSGAEAFDPGVPAGVAGMPADAAGLLHDDVDDGGRVVVPPTPVAVEPELIVIAAQCPPVLVFAAALPGVLVVVRLGPEEGAGVPAGLPLCEGVNPTAARPAEIADRTWAGISPVAATATPPPKMTVARTAIFTVRIFPKVCLLGIAFRGRAARTWARRAATTWSSAASSLVDAGDLAAEIKSAAR
ncbi:MAG TPA: hypothetical protein VMU64_14325 [Acidimicrobiales bacterium]|nr:hypothetical protein [Acidimicrobiales bacterium]